MKPAAISFPRCSIQLIPGLQQQENPPESRPRTRQHSHLDHVVFGTHTGQFQHVEAYPCEHVSFPISRFPSYRNPHIDHQESAPQGPGQRTWRRSSYLPPGHPMDSHGSAADGVVTGRRKNKCQVFAVNRLSFVFDIEWMDR